MVLHIFLWIVYRVYLCLAATYSFNDDYDDNDDYPYMFKLSHVLQYILVRINWNKLQASLTVPVTRELVNENIKNSSYRRGGIWFKDRNELVLDLVKALRLRVN